MGVTMDKWQLRPVLLSDGARVMTRILFVFLLVCTFGKTHAQYMPSEQKAIDDAMSVRRATMERMQRQYEFSHSSQGYEKANRELAEREARIAMAQRARAIDAQTAWQYRPIAPVQNCYPNYGYVVYYPTHTVRYHSHGYGRY